MTAARASLVVALVLSAALVALHVTAVRGAGPLWRDEVNSVNVAAQPTLADVVAQVHFDSFPAAWVVLLHGWIEAGAGDDDAGLRRLGLAVGLATLAALWWSCRRLGVGPPLVSLLLFAASPSVVVYGDAVRGYGLGALAALLATAATWAFATAPGRARGLVALCAAVLAAQTYFANAFLLVAVTAGAALVCARRRDGRTIAWLLAIGLVAAASLLLELESFRYARQVAPIEQGPWSLAWLVEVFRHALAPGVPPLAAAWIALPLAALAGIALAWRSPHADARDRALFALATPLFALATCFFYLRVVARLPTQYWYYLSLIAVLALAVEMGVALLARRWRWGEVARVVVVAGLAIPVVADGLRVVPLRMTNLDVVAHDVAAAARADDLVVVVPWYNGITFRRYYDGVAPWITVPDFPAHRLHEHLAVAERMTRGDAGIAPELARIERTLRDGGRVWLVGEPAAPPLDEAPPHLPPAPHGPQGWRAAPYLDAWELQLGALLQRHGGRIAQREVADGGYVNAWERSALFAIDGWRG